MVNEAEGAGGRLIPRWGSALIFASIGLMVLICLGLALTGQGPLGWSFWAGFVTFLLLFVAAWSALVRRRKPHNPRVTSEGIRIFRAPAATVWPLLGAWLAVYFVAGLWAYVAITDVEALEAPRRTWLLIGAAVASLPDVARLLTGRLHRWQVEIGPDSITYRGYHTNVTYPWSKVHGARARGHGRGRGPTGVEIDVKGAGKDPIVPLSAFNVPAEQLIEEIQRAKALYRS